MTRYSIFFLFALIICAVTGPASAIDDTLRIAYIEAGKEEAAELHDQKKETLSKLQSELEQISDRSRVLRRGQSAAFGYFANTREQSAAVKSLANRIKALKEDIWHIPPWMPPHVHLDSLQLGAVGTLRYPKNATSKVPTEPDVRSPRTQRAVVGDFGSTRQAMAGIQAIEELRRQEILSQRAAVAAMPVEIEVVQVLSQSELVGTAYGNTFIMTGMDTAGIVDGGKMTADKTIVIERTRSHENVLGSTTTVFELRQLSDKEMQLLNASIDIGRPDRLRTWNDRSGSFTVEAELISHQGRDIVLRKKDGGLIKVQAPKLSKEDMEYVDKHLDM